MIFKFIFNFYQQLGERLTPFGSWRCNTRRVCIPISLIEMQISTSVRIFVLINLILSFATGEPRDFKFGTLIYHSKSHPADEKSSLEEAWSGSGDPF